MIYIACPARYATGGIELLHQLCAQIRKYVGAKIWYANANGKPSHMPEYDVYNNPYTETQPHFLPHDVVVLPEIWARYAALYDNPVVYWESVDNFSGGYIPPKTIHLVQSEYARRYVAGNFGGHVIPVTDYLNDDFFAPAREVRRRMPTVLYNPAKGMDFTRKLMQAMPDVKFAPLTGYTRTELISVMRMSRLYIDFGDHPGKDRLPREAAMCGCCVITGRNGSAAYREDVGIPDKYKFDRDDANIPAICNMIRYVLDRYPVEDFDAYREAIRGERARFNAGVDEFMRSLGAVRT